MLLVHVPVGSKAYVGLSMVIPEHSLANLEHSPEVTIMYLSTPRDFSCSKAGEFPLPYGSAMEGPLALARTGGSFIAYRRVKLLRLYATLRLCHSRVDAFVIQTF
jgi:hypothetical protein